MSRKKLFNILASFIISLFLVNYVAGRLYWYYSIWWFDMPMHFLGGFCSGIVLVWLLSYKNLPPKLFLKLFFKAILGVLLIGILWEIFEILVNNALAQNPFDVLDTLSDLFFDLIGGCFAVFFFMNKLCLPEKIG